MPCFETDDTGRCVYVNPAWCELTGLSLEESLGLGWMAALPPEDVERIGSSLREAVESGLASGGTSYRVRCPDESLHRLRVSLHAVELDREIVGWLGWAEDATRTDELRAEASEQAALFSAVFDQTAVGQLVLDLHGRIVRANQRFCAWVGAVEAELIGRIGTELLVEEQREAADRRFAATLEGNELGPAHRRLVDAQGEEQDMWTTAAPITDADGRTNLVVISFAEFSEQADRERTLVHLATHDPLTGLPNRRALDRWIAETSASAAVVVDLDGFKAVNDRHGHHIGDLALIESATRLQRCVRQADLLCRLGGDEFLVLLAEGGTGTASAMVQRISEAFEPTFDAEGRRLSLRATVGVAEGPGPAMELARLADEDLLGHKATIAGDG